MARDHTPRGRHPRRWLSVGVSVIVMAALVALAATTLNLSGVGQALRHVHPLWVIVGLVGMAGSFVCRSESWYTNIRAALPQATVGRAEVLRSLLIGMAGSAVAPGRVGEAARAWLVARRLGPPGATVGVVVGTLVSQTLLNLLALVLLALVALSAGALTAGRVGALAVVAAVPLVVLVALWIGPRVLTHLAGARRARVAAASRWLLAQVIGVRRGLVAFGHLRSAVHMTVVQLLGWGLQVIVCYVTLLALGLDRRASVPAAAAVLVAVNVTAVVPLTPSNVGVFQAACIAVLAGFHISGAQGLAYGLLLQAIEIAVDLGLGIPALLREGASWEEVRQHEPPATSRAGRG